MFRSNHTPTLTLTLPTLNLVPTNFLFDFTDKNTLTLPSHPPPQPYLSKRTMPTVLSKPKRVRIEDRLRDLTTDPVATWAALERVRHLMPGLASGVPLGPEVKLMKHQRRVIRKILTDPAPESQGAKGWLLAAVMGAGKSLMALSCALATTRRGPAHAPPLIVCSKTLLHMWKTEVISKFLRPDHGLRILYLHREYMSKAFIDGLSPAILTQYDLVLTTYDVAVTAYKASGASKDIRVMGRPGVLGESPDRLHHIEKRTRAQTVKPGAHGLGSMFYMQWPLIIADEPQRFANFKTTCFQAMMGLYADRYLFLSGTPTRNKETDIWSLYRVMGYDRIKVPKSRRAGMGWTLRDLDHKDWKTGKSLRDLMIRITKDDVPPLPALIRHTVRTGLNSEKAVGVQKAYLDFTTALMAEARAGPRGTWDAETTAAVLACFGFLRRIAVAPHLVTRGALRPKARAASPGKLCAEAILPPHLLAWCQDRAGPAGIQGAKTKALVAMLQNKIPKQDKVLVFTGFTSTSDLLSEALNAAGITTCKLDGDVPHRHRSDVIDAFRTGPARVLILTYPVGAEGLNLTCANHVVLAEVWWNSAVTDQAIARAHRHGQKKRTVHVWKLITNGTLEDSIVSLCEHKSDLSRVVLGGMSLDVFAKNKRPTMNMAAISKLVESTLKKGAGAWATPLTYETSGGGGGGGGGGSGGGGGGGSKEDPVAAAASSGARAFKRRAPDAIDPARKHPRHDVPPIIVDLS